MIKNRHFCSLLLLLLFVRLFVFSFFVIKKHYLRSIFLLHVPTFLNFRCSLGFSMEGSPPSSWFLIRLQT